MDAAKSPSIIIHDHVVPVTRLLSGAVLPENEERAIKVPGNSWLTRLINPKQAQIPRADRLLVKKWVRGKYSMDDVFQRLELNVDMEKALSSPKIKTYAAFIDRYNTKNPNEKLKMVDMFTKTYGDDVVARIAEIGLNTKGTTKMASRLRRELLDTWEFNGESADDVFKLLKLDEAGYKLFVTPQLNTWFSYTKNVYVVNHKEVMVSVLASKYGYDGLSRIILAANPQVFRMKIIAKDLETAMANAWFKEGLTPDEVFKVLKLDAGAGNLLTNPVVSMLHGYTVLYNFRNKAQEATVIGIFTKFYGFKTMSNLLKEASQNPQMKTTVAKWQGELNKQMLLATKNRGF
ncbi:unnamed protein product [Phytophthora fragariaefolia]|uniref:Unnamed protein product n=1 Tax=Phytophthora fragariaefolia TaxID=1490495 RepID=A0A9W6Y124_9STRA|nr:unnamed protein product [Phytophthora fragariaefolia]